MAYIQGRSIVDNARPHVRKRWLFNIDLTDFFPSIHFGRIRGLLMARPFLVGSEAAGLLAAICTTGGGLPIGAPTSPALSNMICMRLDGQLLRLARDTGCFYTRYADDITFSTNRRIMSPDIATVTESGAVDLGGPIRTLIESNGFDVNSTKTKLQGVHDRQKVTGIIVNVQTNVARGFVRQIRGMIHAWETYGEEAAQSHLPRHYQKDRYPGASPEFRDVLDGKIGYLQMVRGAEDQTVKKFRSQVAALKQDLSIHSATTTTSAGEDPAIRILHLSDFHFDENDRWSSDPVLAGLTDILTNSAAPDLVVVTGDVAQSGSRREYDMAEDWFRNGLLHRLGIEESSVMFVPGNHDVDRSAADEGFQALVTAIDSAERPDATLEAFLSGEPTRRMYLARFREYQAFVSRFNNSHPSGLWWRHRIVHNDLRVQLAGLASPLMSYRDSEQGRLRLGYGIVGEVTGDSGDINILLSHHPLSWMNDDKPDAVNLARQWANIVMHGHSHRESYLAEVSPTSGLITLAAGSAFQGHEWPNSVSILDLRPRTRRLEATVLKWVPEQQHWIIDQNALGSERASFNIP